MKAFLGIPASDGIGIGAAFVIPEIVKNSISQKKIAPEELAEGWNRFQSSVHIVIEQMRMQLENLPLDNQLYKTQRELLEAYVLMLSDAVYIAELKAAYEESHNNIEYAVYTKAHEYAAALHASNDNYLSARAHDVIDVFNLVLNNMLSVSQFDISEIPDGAVIVAETLSPTDTIVLSKKKITGLLLAEGGISSHVVILARSYGIPTITGLTNITHQIQTGEIVIVNGNTADAFVNPDEKTVAEYNKKIDETRSREESLKVFLDKPAQTKDGTLFKLYANVGTPEEAELAKNVGADGIGLFRTEFLYMSNVNSTMSYAHHSFGEEAQFNAYKRVLSIMGDKPVTIRTLDAGGDKLIHSADIPASEEKNPLMGLRAVRLSLAYPQILKTQLRALYRASVYGNLHIMLPLITSVKQVKQCKEIAQTVRDELCAENIPFDENVPIGIMIETAAAAMTADCLAKECDFFSLGTNDLTQYTLAVDRENQSVASLYDEFNLAVLRFIARTLDCAYKANIPAEVCGEMAGKKDSVLVLAGMGFRTLSMSAKLIPSIKETLSQFTIEELHAISARHINNL
ncbi:MAG: phosphoenolpyruvate--protein phosphotransferase [Treponema sp.]|nr:phosphoenolpyruvate--protein phosphotransferase [Treponema sp.]